VHIKFLLCNILPGRTSIWDNVYDICEKYFWKEHLCCLQGFLGALVSQLVSMRTCVQLTGTVLGSPVVSVRQIFQLDVRN